MQHVPIHLHDERGLPSEEVHDVLDAQGVEIEYRGWIYRDLLRPIAEVGSTENVVARYVYFDGNGSRQNGMHQLATRLGANQDTSLPFAGSNVPEYIELLDGSGSVAQRLRLIVNQVGTVQAVADVGTGEAVQRLEYDEFGRVLFDSNPGLQPFGFAGGLADSDTGLVRFGARDYEPVTGRWTARDPVRFAGGLNMFSNSGNDVINFADWNGLDEMAGDPYGPGLSGGIPGGGAGVGAGAGAAAGTAASLASDGLFAAMCEAISDFFSAPSRWTCKKTYEDFQACYYRCTNGSEERTRRRTRPPAMPGFRSECPRPEKVASEQ